MGRTPSEHPLKSWRKAAGLTLAEAATRVGTSRQVWWGWEAGRRRPSNTLMPKVRELTGLSSDVFYCGQVAQAEQREAA